MNNATRRCDGYSPPNGPQSGTCIIAGNVTSLSTIMMIGLGINHLSNKDEHDDLAPADIRR
jgi:hypothetical protein